MKNIGGMQPDYWGDTSPIPLDSHPSVWVNSVVCDDCLVKIYHQLAVLGKKVKF